MAERQRFEEQSRTSAQLRIHLLGNYCVSVGNHRIESAAWNRRKAAAIIKLLALAPGYRLHRDQLLESLWPDGDPERSANAFYQALHAARRILNSNGTTVSADLILRSRGQFLELGEGFDLWVDVDAFEAAAQSARRRDDIAAYHEAIDLYAGDLLPDDRYEPWSPDARRDALQHQFLELLARLAEIYEQRGHFAEGFDVTRRALLVDPLNERAHQLLMRMYARSGQRKLALQQYETLRESLRQELEIEPDRASEQLAEDIRAGRFTVEPGSHRSDVIVASSRPSHNLPAPLNSFVGRMQTKSDARRLLASTRLMTLTGPGGSGKTRLALEVAIDVLDRYPDGIWLVELASLSDPELIPQTIAAALSIRETPGRQMTEMVIGWLQQRRALLLLDNCEHLLESCARFTESLLRVCPELSVIATSREPLRIAGETIFLIPSMTIPDPQRDYDTRTLMEFDAVRLLVDRVSRIQPDFILTADNAKDVAELCYRLDGMPLEIELAAARVRALTLRQIIERLDDRFQLLSIGTRSALSRQQSLRATLDWSYDLLSEPEQVLFSRLCVFAGSFGLAAVEGICAFEPLRPSDVLNLLPQLVDRSLVVANAAGGTARYRLLETMREYGLDRIKERGEADELRRLHARYFADVVAQADREWRGPNQQTWFDRVAHDHDNVRAALEWYRVTQDADKRDAGLMMAGRLHWFWHTRGHFSEGRRWLDSLLEQGPHQTSRCRGTAITGRAVMALSVGQFAAARTLLNESILLWRELDDPAGLALSLAWSGWSELFLGYIPDARARHEEALALFTSVDDRWGIAFATLGLGFDAAELNELSVANSLFEQSLSIFTNLNDDWGTVTTLQQLANVAYRNSDFDCARALVLHVLPIEQRMGDRWLEVQTQSLLGEIARAEGDMDAATDAIVSSLAIAREIGHRSCLAWSLRDAGYVALARGDDTSARKQFRESLNLFSEDNYRTGMACCVIGIACVIANDGMHEDAVRLLGTAHAILERRGIMLAPADLHDFERTRTRLIRMLGEDAFSDAWSEGATASFDDAVTHMLGSEC